MYIFFCRECSDEGVGGWVSTNSNVVQICKSARIIGRSLKHPIVFPCQFIGENAKSSLERTIPTVPFEKIEPLFFID